MGHEFGIQGADGRVTDYELWKELLDPDDLPDEGLVKPLRPNPDDDVVTNEKPTPNE